MDSPRPWARAGGQSSCAPPRAMTGTSPSPEPRHRDDHRARCARTARTSTSSRSSSRRIRPSKGMWCVPVFAKSHRHHLLLGGGAAAGPDEHRRTGFRLFWDNAYAVHVPDHEFLRQVDVPGAGGAVGHPNRPYVFASTSKITFAGASGVSFFGGSRATSPGICSTRARSRSGPDKGQPTAAPEVLR